jgi:hypothetical protein
MVSYLNYSTMKHIFYLFSLASLFTIVSCGSDNDPVNYPISYNFKTKEYEKTKFFLVGNTPTSLTEIAAAGNFKEYDEGMKETIESILEVDDHIKTIELLDDKKARITLFEGSSVEITYTKNGDLLTLKIDPNDEETLDLKTFNLPDSKQQFKLTLSCYLYSFTKNGKKDYSPFTVNNAGKNTDLAVIAKDAATLKGLKANDTIAVNLIQLVYE